MNDPHTLRVIISHFNDTQRTFVAHSLCFDYKSFMKINRIIVFFPPQSPATLIFPSSTKVYTARTVFKLQINIKSCVGGSRGGVNGDLLLTEITFSILIRFFCLLSNARAEENKRNRKDLSLRAFSDEFLFILSGRWQRENLFPFL